MEPVVTNIEDHVYAVLCSHETEDGGVKAVTATCCLLPDTQHKIRQWGDGYICGRCSEMIVLACNSKLGDEKVCYQCAGNEELEQFLASKEICEHPDANITRLEVQCIMADSPQKHELSLGNKPICKACERKLIYKYQGQKECKICEGKTKELLINLRHSLANEQMRMIKKLIIFLSEKKCSGEFKEQLENHCLRRRSQHNKEKDRKHMETCKLKEHTEFLQKFSELNHKESKYSYFTKCPTHKQIALKVCPTCIAVLLNLNMCPYGCELSTLQENRVSKGKQIYETGFLILAPLPSSDKKGSYLQMVLIRNIVIKNKLDHTEAQLKDLVEVEAGAMREDDYPRFGALTSLSGNKYMVTGGLVTRKKEQSITADTWLIEVFNKEGTFSFKASKKAPMQVPRSSHALVSYHEEVYAIGGFTSKGTYTNEVERYSLATNKWTTLPPLKYARAKPTAFVRGVAGKQELVVFGGLSTEMEVTIYGEKLASPDSKEWSILKDGNVSYVDQNTLTRVVSSSSHTHLVGLENLLLFGGSNYQDYSDVIAEYKQKDGQFFFEPLQVSLLSKRAGSQVGVLETSDKTRRKVILFGGCLDHESIIDVDIVNVEIKDNKTLSPIFCEKLSSQESRDYYNLIQSDRKKLYGHMATQLQEQGIPLKDKLTKETTEADETKNRQIIETLWMWGRSIANVQLQKVKL